MPRTQNRIFYKPVDYVKWLKGEMHEKKLAQKDIADWLNVTQVAVSKKMINHSFSYMDMLIIFQKLGTEKEEQIKVML